MDSQHPLFVFEPLPVSPDLWIFQVYVAFIASDKFGYSEINIWKQSVMGLLSNAATAELVTADEVVVYFQIEDAADELRKSDPNYNLPADIISPLYDDAYLFKLLTVVLKLFLFCPSWCSNRLQVLPRLPRRKMQRMLLFSKIHSVTRFPHLDIQR